MDLISELSVDHVMAWEVSLLNMPFVIELLIKVSIQHYFEKLNLLTLSIYI